MVLAPLEEGAATVIAMEADGVGRNARGPGYTTGTPFGRDIWPLVDAPGAA